MEKETTLILTQTEPDKDMMFMEWIREGYCADITFKNVSKPLRLIRRIWILLKLPYQHLWYGVWKEKLHCYDTIILHIEYLQKDIPGYIHKRKPNMRVICWYWNKVNSKTRPDKIKDKNVEYWTFNKADVEKYKMKQNIQYYIAPQKENVEEMNISSDIFFVGHSHGRRNKIEEFCEKAQALGCKCDVNIIENAHKNSFTYEEVQNKVRHTRAILEIVQAGQNGYTLRTMESLFFSKKLITDNIAIQEAPFYNKCNIFMIGVDKMEYLREFMKLPYDKSVEKYQKQYDVNAWFENFAKADREDGKGIK